MSDRPMMWAGYWAEGQQYQQGDVVILNGQVFISRSRENGKMPTMHESYDWVYIGAHEPHKIDHPWMPEMAAYPLSGSATGLLSAPTPLCRECWYTNNYVLAFKPEDHWYTIQEEAL